MIVNPADTIQVVVFDKQKGNHSNQNWSERNKGGIKS